MLVFSKKIMICTNVFQANDAGSIPAARSKMLLFLTFEASPCFHRIVMIAGRAPVTLTSADLRTPSSADHRSLQRRGVWREAVPVPLVAPLPFHTATAKRPYPIVHIRPCNGSEPVCPQAARIAHAAKRRAKTPEYHLKGRRNPRWASAAIRYQPHPDHLPDQQLRRGSVRLFPSY